MFLLNKIGKKYHAEFANRIANHTKTNTAFGRLDLNKPEEKKIKRPLTLARGLD